MLKNKTHYFVFRSTCCKSLTRVRLQFSFLDERKLRHGFSDTINPMCACGTEVELPEYFLLRCHF